MLESPLVPTAQPVCPLGVAHRFVRPGRYLMLSNTGASFGPSPTGDGAAATLPGLNTNALTPSPIKQDYHELLDISGLQMLDGEYTAVQCVAC